MWRTSSNNPSYPAIRYLYDGDALVAEYNAGGTMLRRYVHGPAAGIDDPMVAYEGSSVAASAKRYLYADERGSIIAISDANGTMSKINTYDEFGIPGAGNATPSQGGRFGYTGQVFLPEIGLYYYKARMYSPHLGRFMQTDPIGYGDGMNMYAYVGNDPMNAVDPWGLESIRPPIELPPIRARCGRDEIPIGPPDQAPWGCASRLGLDQWFGSQLPARDGGDSGGGTRNLIIVNGTREPQSDSERCSGPRVTLGGGAGLTGFIFNRGVTFNIELGLAFGKSLSQTQLYLRGSAAGLAGGGAFGGAGINGSGGITSGPLTTGYSNDKILAAGAAYGAGGEIIASTGNSHGGAITDPSVTASYEGGLGGYIAAGDRHTLTGVLIGGC